LIWPTCVPVKKADRDWKRRLLSCCDGLGEGFSFENNSIWLKSACTVQLETLRPDDTRGKWFFIHLTDDAG
jgi:hypothetical protein